MKLLRGKFYDRVLVSSVPPLLAAAVQGSTPWLAVRASPSVVHIFQASRLQAVLHFPEDIVSLEWALARPWHVQNRQPHPLLLLSVTSALQRSWLLQVTSTPKPPLLPSTSVASQHTAGAPQTSSPLAPHAPIPNPARFGAPGAEPDPTHARAGGMTDDDAHHLAPWTAPDMWEVQEAEPGAAAQPPHVEESHGVRVTACNFPVKVPIRASQDTQGAPNPPAVFHLALQDACAIAPVSPAGLPRQDAGLVAHAVWETVAAGTSPVLAAVLEHSLRMDGRLRPTHPPRSPHGTGACPMDLDSPPTHTMDQGCLLASSPDPLPASRKQGQAGPPSPAPQAGSATSRKGISIRPLPLSGLGPLQRTSSGLPHAHAPENGKPAPASKIFEWLSDRDTALEATCSVLLTATEPAGETGAVGPTAASPVLLECGSRCSCSPALLQALLGSPTGQSPPSSCLIYGDTAGNLWAVPCMAQPKAGVGRTSAGGATGQEPVLLFQLDASVLEILPFRGAEGPHRDPGGLARGLVVVSAEGRVVWLTVASEACAVHWSATQPAALWGGRVGHVKVAPASEMHVFTSHWF